MDGSLEDQLYARYPLIFQERSLPETKSAMYLGIGTGNGWFHLIDVLCAALQRETDTDRAPQVVATQVKEKFGGLRFYTHEITERQASMIELARDLSERTCDVCGAPGSPVAVGRRRATRCNSHADS